LAKTTHFLSISRDVTGVSYIEFVGNVRTTGSSNWEESTVDAFTRNLPEMLCAMALDGGKFICIAELRDRRYVQFLVKPSWHIYSEVVSNLNIVHAVALSTEDEDRLRVLGFHEPAPDRSPNWHMQSTDSGDLLHIANVSTLAMRNSLHTFDDDPIFVKTWRESPPVIERV
jgi:hypothetical protein